MFDPESQPGAEYGPNAEPYSEPYTEPTVMEDTSLADRLAVSSAATKPVQPHWSVESLHERDPMPGFEILKGVLPNREPHEPAYNVGTVFQAKAKSYMLDAEVVGIAWEQPKYERDNQGVMQCVRLGNRHLYRIRQLRNGMSHILAEVEILQYYDYYKAAEGTP